MKYELALMHKETLTEDKVKQSLSDIKDFLTSLSGKVEKEDYWGKRKLAYKVDKFTDAYYTIYEIDLPAEGVKKLTPKLRNNQDVLRSLLVKKDN